MQWHATPLESDWDLPAAETTTFRYLLLLSYTLHCDALLTRASVAGQAVTGFRARGERVRTIGCHGRDWWCHDGGRGDGRTTAASAVVMRHVIVMFRTRPGQAVRVLIVGERVLVTRWHHDHGSGQVRLSLMEMVAAAVPRMAFQRVSLFLLVREEFRLEVCK